jgi:hypothetical protein
MALAQADEFEPVAGDLPNAQHGVAADRAPLRVEIAAGTARERQMERLAILA